MVRPSVASGGDAWDRFVMTAPGGDVVQTAAWGRSKRALGFEVYQVSTRAGGAIVGGGQIVIRCLGALGGVGYVARGPLLSEGHLDQAPRVLDEIERFARDKSVRHLIVQPVGNAGTVAEALAARGYRPSVVAVAPTATVRIDLSASLDTILARMSQTRRRDIRRADRLGLEVRMAERKDIAAFCELHRATAQRQGFSALSRAYFEHQWDALHDQGWLRLFLAYDNGRPTAGTWLTAFGDTATERIQGWTGEGRNVPSNVSCLWYAIRWAKTQGFRFYDLGGIRRSYAELGLKQQALPDEFHRSTDAFKIRFGGELVLLPTPSELTFNPVIGACGRVLLRCMAGRKSWRNLLHRMRSK
ncbi:MAG: lipid II:glycine glycyltransferase FemX [Dongiaceae bacterium]